MAVAGGALPREVVDLGEPPVEGRVGGVAGGDERCLAVGDVVGDAAAEGELAGPGSSR